MSLHIKALMQIEGIEIRAICDKNPLQAEQAMAWFEGSDHRPEIYADGEDSKGHGHGGSDLRMDWHIIDCLRNGLPMPQDVYHAAAWSSLVPLTSWSAQNRSNSIDIPDFTCGAWETNPRNMDINLENGGGNTRILPP